MPAIAAGDLTLLRAGGQRSEWYLSASKPLTLWSARVNNLTIARAAQTIAFDGGTGSHWSAVEAHQTVWVGSAAGLRDKGRVRIKSVSSGDAGVTGTLVVSANGIVWSDDDYLTFKHDYELWAAMNRVDANEVFYKDWDNDGGLNYSNQNTNIPPVAIAGPHQAGFLVSGTCSLSVPVGSSYAMASAATISTKQVTVYPTTGVTVNAEAAGVVQIDYTVAGQYWVKVVATDSNGTAQSTFRRHFVHNSSPSSVDYPHVDFSHISINGEWDKGGWSATIRVDKNALISDIPDGTLVVLWRRTWYGDTQKDISILPYGKNIGIAGYIRTESISREESGASLSRGTVSFGISTVQDLLTDRPMFSVPLEIAATVDTWWKYPNGLLTAGHIVHYLYRWHSTLLHVADVIGLNDDGNIDRKAIDFDKGNLYHMGDEFTSRRGIMAHLVCDKSGRFHMARNLTLRDDTVRGAQAVIATLTAADTTDPVTFIHSPEPKVGYLFYSGITWDGTTATPIGSVSPDEWPEPRGGNLMQIEYQMIENQAGSNEITGQIFATENNEWPEVRMAIHGDYLGILDPAIMEWFEMDVQAADTIKGFVWTDKKMLLRKIACTIDLPGGVMSNSLELEPEVNGTPGVPYKWPDIADFPDPGGDLPEPAAEGEGYAVMTGASVYYLPGGKSTWQLRTADAMNDIVDDPYWTTITENPTSAIILSAEGGQIRRSTNSGQTWSTLAPGNPPNDAGDSPAPVLANLTFLEVDGSWGNQNTFVWLARWQNGSGDWRTWLLYTGNSGSTFTWKSMGAAAVAGSMDVKSTSISYTTFSGDMSTVEMSTDKFLTSFNDDGGIQLVLMNWTGSAWSSLDTHTLTASAGGSHHELIRLTDTKAMLGYAVGGNSFRVIIIETTTDTISEGTELTIDTVVSQTSLSLCRSSIATTAHAVYSSSAGGTALYHQALSISGTTISKSGSKNNISSVSAADIETRAIGHPTVTDKILVAYKNVTTSNRPYAVRVTVLPSFSAGTPLELDTNSMSTTFRIHNNRQKLCPIAPESDVFQYNWITATSAGLRMIAIDATSATLTKGSIVNGADNAKHATCHTHGNGVVLNSYFETVTDEIRSFTTSISGTTITNNGDQFVVETHAGSDTNASNTLSTGASTGVLVWAVDFDVYYYRISIAPGTVPNRKALGMAVGRGAGNKVYVTGVDGGTNKLILSPFTLPAVTAGTEVELGSATIAQADARTWWAHPFCPWGGVGDDEVILFGRMNNPGGLGTVHILHSIDAGVSVLPMESGWDDDHAGAIAQDDVIGWVYIIRNVAGAGAKLYRTIPGGVPDLLSTIPTTGGVNPKAISAAWDDQIIVGLDRSGSPLVVYTADPYVAWNDITGNHATTNAIKSVLVLGVI